MKLLTAVRVGSRGHPFRDAKRQYAPFFSALRTIGYDKRISMEASTQDLPADAPKVNALLRRALQSPLSRCVFAAQVSAQLMQPLCHWTGSTPSPDIASYG